jgi:hypothetical protein
VNVPEYLEIITPNPMTDSDPKKINIPYGLNMGLSITEFSVYDDDETKNITFPKGLRIVTEGFYLQAWKPGTVINSNLANQIKIPYGTDLSNYNKYTFRQSVIDNAIINCPCINLFDKITSGVKFSTIIKSSIGDDIYPKTTHT